MTDATDEFSTTDPLSRTDRDAIFRTTRAPGSLRAFIALAVVVALAILGFYHVWLPMLACGRC